MDVLRSVVVVIHLAGMAMILGPLIGALVARRFEFTPVMSYGMVVALISGFFLAGSWGGYHPNVPKLIVKMALLLVLGAIIGMGSAQAKKTGKPVPAALVGAAAGVAVALVAVAVIW